MSLLKFSAVSAPAVVSIYFLWGKGMDSSTCPPTGVIIDQKKKPSAFSIQL
ncbi:hypothetical protein H8E88_34970 [candidate division KSB1 bacterium]|nr:hypothetical protein [candidate division KSB1 bacterium]